MMPAECVLGVLLRNPLAGTKINYELPGYYKTIFKVIVRAQNYTDGTALMQTVYDTMTLTETVVGTMTINFLRPLTMPASFPLSKGNLIEFAADFEVSFTL